MATERRRSEVNLIPHWYPWTGFSRLVEVTREECWESFCSEPATAGRNGKKRCTLHVCIKKYIDICMDSSREMETSIKIDK